MSNLWCLARNAASSFEHHEHQAARRRSCWVRPAAGARELPDLRCGTAPCLGGIRDLGTLLRLQAAVPGRPWAAGQGSAGRTGSGLLTTVVSHNLGRRTRSFRKQEQRAGAKNRARPSTARGLPRAPSRAGTAEPPRRHHTALHTLQLRPTPTAPTAPLSTARTRLRSTLTFAPARRHPPIVHPCAAIRIPLSCDTRTPPIGAALHEHVTSEVALARAGARWPSAPPTSRLSP